MKAKKFKESLNTSVFTTKFVLFEKKEITMVYHDEEDGAWQFFSDDKFDNFEDVAKIAGLGEILEIDDSLIDLAEMPTGYRACRVSKQDKWVIEKISE